MFSRYIVEGRISGDQWAAEAVGSLPVTFATEAEAQAAVDDLVLNLGWSPDDLRIVTAHADGE